MTLPTAEELARIVEYVAQYGGRCRDCADEDGICPSSGLACDTAVERKAIKFVVERLQYGVGHGFIRSPFEGGRSMDAKDVDQAFQAWWAIPATFDSDEHLSRMAFEAGFLASRPTTPEAQLAEKMPRDVHQLDEWIAEAYQEGYAEGQGDATNVHSEFCQTMWQWLDDRNLLGEPEADPPGYTATQMMDSVYAHENALAGIIDDLQAVVRARDAKIAKATEVLKFYGERDNYAPRESDITQSWINCDDGIRARSVLAEMEGKT